MKKSKRKNPRIIKTIEESNLSEQDKKEAINHIMKIVKSDSRIVYSKFDITANTLSKCFNWNITYPGYDYWSNLNNKLQL